MPDNELADIQTRYATRYALNWRDYHYLWHPRNRISVYYRQAQERAIVDLLNQQSIHLDRQEVLDVGSGYGSLARFLVSLGADPVRVIGCDLMLTRLAEARRLNPGLAGVCSSAECLPLKLESFDLVTQFTVFSSVSRRMQAAFAEEIERVLRPGGKILWYDMRSSSPEHSLRGIERADLDELFTRCVTRVIRPLHAAAIPRLLRFGSCVPALADCLPFLRRTHYLALLEKTK